MKNNATLTLKWDLALSQATFKSYILEYLGPSPPSGGVQLIF